MASNEMPRATPVWMAVKSTQYGVKDACKDNTILMYMITYQKITGNLQLPLELCNVTGQYIDEQELTLALAKITEIQGQP